MRSGLLATLAILLTSGPACEKRDHQARPAAPPAAPARNDGGARAPAPLHHATDPAHPGDPGEEPPGPPPFRSTQGNCSTAYAPRPKRDRFPMCKVTGGSFMMGAPDGETGLHPRHRVRVSTFYMDQLEVTNAQYLVFLNLVGTTKFCPSRKSGECIVVTDDLPELPIHRDASGRFSVPAAMEDHPVVGVSLEGAERYCKWAGKQLPTQAQWEYAAAHDPATGHDRRYPWGDTFEPDRANCGAPCKDGIGRTTARVGTFDGTHGHGDGASAFGIRDMAGNVGEYVRDYYNEPYAVCDPECVDPVGKRNPKFGDQWFFRPQDFDAKFVATWETSNVFAGTGFGSGGFRCTATATN